MRQWLWLALVFGLGSLSVGGQPSEKRLYARVTANQTQIVFGLAGDLWRVDKAGGTASQLTSTSEEEGAAAFSPDGQHLAFSRQSGGNWDIYLMPATGGEARRLTFHPRNDIVVGWHPDGKHILYRSNASGVPKLYSLAVDGVLPTELPFDRALTGSYSPDGNRLAFNPNLSLSDWRYYRGGYQGQIWLTDVKTGVTERVPQLDFNNDMPVWLGNTIYFLSDRTGVHNLFAFDVKTRRTTQLTTFEQFGIQTLGQGPQSLVFVRDGQLYLFEVNQPGPVPVPVSLTVSVPERLPRTVDASPLIDSVVFGMSGDSLAVGARGEIFLVEPATGKKTNLTQTSGVAERWPVLSPDGKWVAYFSDESGEYQLCVKTTSGSGIVKRLAIEAKPSFYRELLWSPDGKKLVFCDRRLGIWLAEPDQEKVSRIDTTPYSYQIDWHFNWSPDGRWLAYSKSLASRIRTIFVYDTHHRQLHQMTSGKIWAEFPCFDAGGKYLYFVSSPNAALSGYGWGVLNGVMARPGITRRLHLVSLRESDPLPFLPDGKPNPAAKADEILTSTTIDFANLATRMVNVPIPEQDFAQLLPGKPGVVFALTNEWPSPPVFTARPRRTLSQWNLTSASKFEKIAENTPLATVSGDGTTLFYQADRDWILVPTLNAPSAEKKKLDLSKLELNLDPSAEWKQLYRESWHIMRDWFYDPNFHGQDLAFLERHYAAYLPNITRRADLNTLLNRMLGHVSVSHLVVDGGDVPPPVGQPSRGGLLGADFEIAEGKYRFKRILRTSTLEDPLGLVPAPLDRPDARVADGSFVLAIDGKPVEISKPIDLYLEGKANRPVQLTVASDASGRNSQTLTVYPLTNEATLRAANQVKAFQQRVDEASQGQLGYVYVANYGAATMDAIRGLLGNSQRKGVIIDQRYNGGGITPDFLIEWLQRKPLYFYTFREGDDIATPVNPGPQVKVLMTNELNGSAAETFAFMFKLAKLGPIVGKRTFGGGIGPYFPTPDLLDGGFVQLPNRAAYQSDGTSWGIENIGVSPTIEVDILPADVLAGRDPQLEKAIEAALAELKKTKAPVVRKPKYPVHPK